MTETGRRRGSMAALGLLLVLVPGCGDADPPWTSPFPLDTAQVVIRSSSDSAVLLVELADTEQTRSMGLMSRPSLDAGSGMLFRYDSIQAGGAGFWMWQTRIPLDIAFLDSAGVILRILPMEPCESELYQQACPSYAPGVPYTDALEVNRGWFADQGIEEGDTVTLVAPSR